MTGRVFVKKVIEKLRYHHLLDWIPDKPYLELMYWVKMDHRLDLKNPRTFNEKLQWLKLYNRRPEYTMMADKVLVRDYIAKTLGPEYLIPLLGVWDDPDEIDFDKLPDRFVLKCNHNSGLGMCICKDKSKLDIDKVRADLRKGLKQNYYLTGREWPYQDIPRKILCEQYMEDGSGKGLTDYKFYCFDGRVKLVGIYQNRNALVPTTADYFSRDYKWQDFLWGYPHAEVPPEKPKEFGEMVKLAEVLSEGFCELRVDLYLCGDKIYFGELTFFDGSGFDEFTPEEWDTTLGDWIALPQKAYGE